MDKNLMDDLVRNAIGDLEAPYEDQDWELMNAQLDDHYAMRRKVLMVKGIELCLMILTIWTVVQFVQTDSLPQMTIHESGFKVPSNEQKQQSVLPLPTEETKQENVVIPHESEQNEQGEQPAGVPFAGTQEDEQLQDASDEFVFKTVKPIAALNYQSINQNHLPIDQTLHESNQLNNQSEFELVGRPNSTTKVKTVPLVYHRTPIKDMERLESYKLKPLAVEEIKIKPQKGWKLRFRFKEPPKDKPYKYGIFASSELNTIKEQAIGLDAVIASKQPQNFSYAGGLGINFELSPNWELETGLAATSFTYTERGRVNFGSTNATISELKDVEMDMVEIPVNIQYNFSKLASEKLRVYALAGVTNRFVTAIRNVPREFTIGGPVNNLPEPKDFEANLKDEGIFEGGGLNNNYYVSANLGFGVERVISKRWSLFIQPTYKQALTKVGSQNDAISSFSLMAGTRASL